MVELDMAEPLSRTLPTPLTPRRDINHPNSLSSIGWGRRPGRGGAFCEAAPLGPLPTAAARGEEVMTCYTKFAQKGNAFMDSSPGRGRSHTRCLGGDRFGRGQGWGG